MTRPHSLSGHARLSAVLGAVAEPTAGAAREPGEVRPPPPPTPPGRRDGRPDPPTVPLPLLAGPDGVAMGPGVRAAQEGEGLPARPRGPTETPPRPHGPDLTGVPPAEPDHPGGRVGSVLRRIAPAAWRGARVDPGRPGATALALVAAAAAVLAAVGVWFERPRAEPVADLPAVSVAAEPAPSAGALPSALARSAAPESAPSAPAPQPPAAPLVVAVSGKVHRPGLVEVPQGSRVADVLEAAGGALPGTDLAEVNLARRVADGEQVAVGVPPAPDAAPASPGAATAGETPGAPGGPVDLNTATASQLDALPGVGPVTAQRILEWRASNGRFARVEQLREVDGIGERRFAQLRELVRV